MNFRDIVGQDALVGALRGALARGRFANAYLFTGPAGAGKRSLADICVRALYCRGADKPCDRCPPCERVLSGNHPDVHVIEAGKSIGVDAIRDLSDEIARKPYEGGRHAVLIDGADAMTAQAQNALLKTLEDPPGEATFFLLADSPHKLLPTVRSRCRTARLLPLAEDDEAALLQRRGVNAERARLLARVSQGSAGRALALDADEAYWAMRARVADALASLKGPESVALAAQRLKNDKERADDALGAMESWARDRMALSLAPAFGLDWEDSLRAADVDGERLLEGVLEARRMLASNVAWTSVLETLFFRAIGG